jgi:hypothetical protein
MIVSNDLEEIWKELVVTEFKALHLYLLGGLRKTTEASMKIVGVPVQIPTELLSKTCQKHYCLSQLARPLLSKIQIFL